MRRRGKSVVPTVLAALLVALSLPACTQSRVDPDAAVTLSGIVARDGGEPLGNTAVSLHVDPGPSILFWTPAILASLGTACATDLCGADHQTRSDATGRYRFALRGSQVQGSFGEETTLLVEAGAPAGPDEQTGPVARIHLVVRTEETRLPDLRLWDPEVAIASDAVRWEPPSGADREPSETLALFQRPDGARLWQGAATPTGLSIDPRILEDSAGGVAGVATVPVTAPDGVSGVELRTGTRRYRSMAGRPVSRGAACTAFTDDGASTALAPCHLTDGDLVTPTHISVPCTDGEQPCPRVTAVEVWLDGERPVQLVVVRGCAECSVEVAGQATQLTERFAAVPFEARAAVVRITGPVDELQEVSVWDAPAAGGLVAVAVEPHGAGGEEVVGDAGAGGFVGGVDDGRPSWPLLLATLLLGLSAGALLVVGLQRRR